MTSLRPIKLLQVEPTSTVAAVEVGVEPTTGSATVQVPIPLTPGRDGFGPSLSLTFGGYDPLSPFAHGWSLAGLPSIDIDVHDGLPAYDGTERYRYRGQDLVPLESTALPPTWPRDGYDVRAFRARIESQPIRAEQWTHSTTGRVHWRVRSGDGTVQVFGRRADNQSRICEPHEPNGPNEPQKTFRWLLEAAFDRFGNAMLVEYAPEDAVGVDPSSLDAARFAGLGANRYPKRILYGNTAPRAESDDTSLTTWRFEAVFDYGDHDAALPQPTPTPSLGWPVRQDVGFTARPGFELRTRRLCRRVLMFHRFPTQLGEPATLVGSLELDHDEAPDATTLSAVRYVGWRTQGGTRVSQTTPWATFEYTTVEREDAFTVLPAPMLGARTQLVDLFGEGLPGLLTLDESGARYARSLGDGQFGPHEPLLDWPVGLAGGTLADFDGDGNVELVQLTGTGAGYYRLDRRTRRWQALQRFDAALNLDPEQGRVLQADLSGDGRPDLVFLHEGGLTWWPNRGEDGFGDPIEVRLPAEKLPVPNLPLDRFLADMTGDGLADIVEVQNGSVRYWPNLGRGQFGEPVEMDDAPRLDFEGSYDAARVLLVDLDQTGAADLLYLRGDGVLYRAENRRGASFGPLTPIAWGAPIPNGAPLQMADLYGDGSSCLVWTGPSGAGSWAFHALRLVSSPGARQLRSVTHPLGATTELEWGHSVRHYLRDVESGRGWDTPLPSQRPVVDAVHRTEPIDGQSQSERFAYHDGHYDPRERGFALFAVVDRLDADPTAPLADVVPLMTRRFSHTGEVDYGSRFERHHYAKDLEARPPPSLLDDVILPQSDFEEAWRALTGTPVREEVYATDLEGVPAEDPLRITAASRSVRLVRTADARYRTGLQLLERDTLELVYEESPLDPRYTLQRALDVDAYLVPRLTLQAGMPRRDTNVAFAAQGRVLATASTTAVEHLDTELRFELAVPIESRAFEVHVPLANVEDVYQASFESTLQSAVASATPYHQPLDPLSTTVDARELMHERLFYWNDTQTDPLPLGEVGPVTLPHHSERSAYDGGQIKDTLDLRIDPELDLPPLGYVADGDVFYQLGPVTAFDGPTTFYRLYKTTAFDGGSHTTIADEDYLAATMVIDEVGNTTSADVDYHVLAPWRIADPNGTVQEVDYDPLGVTRRTSRHGSALDASANLVPHGFGALTPGQALPTFAAALAAPETELGTAESLLLYEFPAGGQPMRTLALAAEQLVDRGPDAGSAPARAQVALAYVDGFGRELQRRVLVEPGLALVDDGFGGLEEASSTNRWRVSGHVVFDAKQQPRQEFEPFFRDGHVFESALTHRQFGVATTTTYDALGRPVRRDLPNGTFTDTTFTPWSQTVRDPNDTVLEATEYVSARDWRPLSDPERQALDQALLNAGTPITTHLDPLGREIAKVEVIELAQQLTEEARLDIRGLSEATIDRRGLTASTRAFDRLGRLLLETSIDAGAHRALFDAAGREVRHWHEDTAELRVYDLAGRLVERHVDDGTTSWLAERMTYGESLSNPEERNARGRLVLLEDGAGRLEHTRYGAFGEPLEVERTLTADAGLDPDWSGTVALESTTHETRSAFDALGRRTRAFMPDGTERLHEYLRSGPTSRLELVTAGANTITLLESAEYNARGQQIAQELGNGVEVSSVYDEETFRLYQRYALLPGTDPYQDLRHHYDPVGNLVYVDDLAQSPSSARVINGLTVSAERTYRYDARYQLVEATGRVHNALTRPDYRGDEPTAGSFRGTRRVGLNDGGAVSRYVRTYEYDAGGNLTRWDHAPEPGQPGNSWANEKWVSPTSNRSLPAYDLNGLPISNPETHFDSRGHLTKLPNVREMVWSARAQLRRVVLIERVGGTDDDELYDYAADGTRLRKTTRRLVSGNVEVTTTVYLDGCELRRVTRAGVDLLERWSSHVQDGDHRVATVYAWTLDIFARETDDDTAVRTHYHLGNHLGSVSLELNEQAELLAYEEYFPYGRTAFVAGDSVREIGLRTLRYVGKDQDDATGFYVFQFRYYAPYLGTWVSPDPAGEVDGPNRYWYARNRPTVLHDRSGLQASSPARLAPFWRVPEGLAGIARAHIERTGQSYFFTSRVEVSTSSELARGTQFRRSRDELATWARDRGATLFEVTPDALREYDREQLERAEERLALRPGLPGSGAADAPADRGLAAGAPGEEQAWQDLGALAAEPSGDPLEGLEDVEGYTTASPAGGSAASAGDADGGDVAAGAPSIQWGRLRGDGSVELLEIPIHPEIAQDPSLVRHIEDQLGRENEDQTARRATGRAFLSGLTFGITETLGVVAQRIEQGDIEGATSRALSGIADIYLLLPALNPGRSAHAMLTSSPHMVAAVDDWFRSTVAGSLATPGLDSRRLYDPRASTPEQRARQDEARGQRWSLPLQLGAEAIGARITLGFAMAAGGVRPPSPADGRLSGAARPAGTPRPGELRISYYDTRRGPHWTAETRVPGKEPLVTHQIWVDRRGNRTRVVRVEPGDLGDPTDVRTFELPDVDRARSMQETQIKRGVTGEWVQRGPRANSCATVVCEVGHAGRGPFPGPREPGLAANFLRKLFGLPLLER